MKKNKQLLLISSIGALALLMMAAYQENFRQEWRQMFTEAWRLERDFFYDRNMHGVDWKAMPPSGSGQGSKSS